MNGWVSVLVLVVVYILFVRVVLPKLGVKG